MGLPPPMPRPARKQAPRATACARSASSLRTLSLALALLLAGPPAWAAPALPTGGQISAGAGTISQPSASKLVVNQASNKLSVNWQSFSIGAGNTVQFVQPSASSIALNRVVGNDPSVIYGNLTANGQVFLINGNGVLFAPGAQVSTGGLVASTLNLTDQNFLAGNYTFSDPGNTNAVVNQGTLKVKHGGTLALIGSQVVNTGTLKAKRGSIVLGAGDTAQLTLADNKLVSFEVSQNTVNALAQNGGLVRANGGQVIMTAGAADSLVASTVNNTGVVEAQTVQGQGGHILLLSGMEAGTTEVGGTLDASAPAARNPNGGNGGTIETSGHRVAIASSAVVTTQAAQGSNGSWTIDPQDFTIASSGGDMTGAALSTALGSNNVTIESSQGATAGQGDINVDDNVTWAANTLTLTAANNININAAMTANGTANLAMNTGLSTGGTGDVNVGMNGTATAFTGQVNFNGTGNLTINGNPYTILRTWQDLANLQNNVNSSGDIIGYYALGGDIDLSQSSVYSPFFGMTFGGIHEIGTLQNPFMGTFNGLGHVIRNMILSPTSWLVDAGNTSGPTYGDGLFGAIGAGSTVSNLGIVTPVGGANAVWSGASSIGLSSDVSGSDIGLMAGANAGILHNVWVNDSSTSFAQLWAGGQNAYIGGLVGYNTGTITNAGVNLNLYQFGSSNLGGLVGYNSGSISNAFSIGTMFGNGGNREGGLVGYNNGALSNVYSTMSVEAIYSSFCEYCGGLVGYADTGSTITNAYATGAVGGDYLGSAVAIVSTDQYGHNYGYATLYGVSVGGLVGADYGTINQSYATGNVNGTLGVGGLVGVQFGGSINNSYATGSVAGSITLAQNNALESTIPYSNGLLSVAYYSFSSGGSVDMTTMGTGGLVGYLDGVTSVSNSHATGNVSSTGTINTGGLIGSTGPIGGQAITISNSYATGDVAVLLSSGNMIVGNAGGLIGAMLWTGTISNSWSSGNVAAPVSVPNSLNDQIDELSGASAGGNIGGFVGYTAAGNIRDSYSTGNVTVASPAFNVGGFAGEAVERGGALIQDYSTGDVNVQSGTLVYRGGVGGFVGSGLNITQSYSSGSVQIASDANVHCAGAFISSSSSCFPTNGSGVGDNYYLATAANAALGSDWASSVATGLTAAQMEQASSYAGWSITDAGGGGSAWRIYDGYTMPLLETFLAPLTITAGNITQTYDGAAANYLSNASYSIPAAATNGLVLGLNAPYGSASNVGSYSPTGLYSTQQGYDITTVGGTLTIDPATLTVTANNASQTPNGVPYAGGNGVSYSGFAAGDNAGNALSGTLTYGGTSQGAVNLGDYTIVPGGLTAGNYTLRFVNGTLVIGYPPAPASNTTSADSSLSGSPNVRGAIAAAQSGDGFDWRGKPVVLARTPPSAGAGSGGAAMDSGLFEIVGAGVNLPPGVD